MRNCETLKNRGKGDRVPTPNVGWRAVCHESGTHGSEGGQGLPRVRLSYPTQKATKEPEHRFENLYGLLCHEVWLRVAAHTVLQNKGSGTAGIDGMTKSNFLGDPDGYI